jgi:hypothetical protein
MLLIAVRYSRIANAGWIDGVIAAWLRLNSSMQFSGA